tara:strand:- start:1747 stop:1923 length:177 start_codon:yes stop_codon:yes gene_type:complete
MDKYCYFIDIEHFVTTMLRITAVTTIDTKFINYVLNPFIAECSHYLQKKFFFILEQQQ